MAHEADTRVNRDARPKLHAGEGHLVSNIVTFVVLLAVFLLGFYVLQTATFTSVWEFAASIALCSLAYFVPCQLIGRGDSHNRH